METSVFKIKYTTIALILFSMIISAVPTHYATVAYAEYMELKLAAKPAQDRKDLAALGYPNDYIDSPIRFAAGE